jgi:hypothetical protein
LGNTSTPRKHLFYNFWIPRSSTLESTHTIVQTYRIGHYQLTALNDAHRATPRDEGSMAPENASQPKRKQRENRYEFDVGVRGRHVSLLMIPYFV